MINQKRLLMCFKSSNSFKTYAIEMFTWIAQIKSLCSEQMAHRLKGSRFVNWNGGKGNNIACDMAQEICNRISKDLVKSMGANKTPKAMMRASKAAAGVHLIVKQVNEVSGIKPTSQVHAHKESSGKVIMMFKDLKKLRPFDLEKGRFHRNFQEIIVSPTSSVNMSSLFSWLEKHKKQIAMGQTDRK